MSNPIVRMCKVVSVIDDTDGDRIKVRFVPEDNHISNVKDLPYVFPLLPKMFHVKPKIGECVFVFSANGDGNSLRYYVGPIVTQPHHMEEEPYTYDAMAYFKGELAPDPAPSMNPETHGAFFDEGDVGIYGRKNTELKLSDTDAQLRAGARLADDLVKRDVIFNTKNPSYLKLKYHTDEQLTEKGQTYQSTATIVADKINLISNKSKDYFKTTDRDDLIDDDTMKEIIDKAHQLPYGDILIEFLELFRNAFLNHVHPYPRMKPCIVGTTAERVQGYDLNKILSNDVRIN